jgi:hypothetical protein
MNLHLTVDGFTVDLWQTPTYITEMCLMTSKGVKSSMTGKHARRAMNIYFNWCRYSVRTNNIMSAVEHIKEIEPLLTDDVDIEVYMM